MPDRTYEWNNLAQTVVVDFDGTLHPYTEGWVGYEPSDEPPIDGVVEFLRGLTDDGFRVVVSTCRADTQQGRMAVREWLDKHDLDQYVDEVTDVKPSGIAYVDDRAVPFHGDWAAARAAVDRLAAGKPE